MVVFSVALTTLASPSPSPPPSPTAARRGAIGVVVADYLIRRWPELDATPADCAGPGNCFSLDFATVPAGPSPKFWEYTYGVPLAGLQRLYEKTGVARYLAFVKKYVDR